MNGDRPADRHAPAEAAESPADGSNPQTEPEDLAESEDLDGFEPL